LFRTLMGDEGKPVQKYQSKFNPEESSVGREREREREGKRSYLLEYTAPVQT